MKLELISNPLARKGQASRVFEKARQIFVDLGVEVEAHYPESIAASTAVISKIAERRSGRVVVVGGDGMVSVAANVLVGTDTTMALIPAGRGNDFARSLNIPQNLEKAVKLALTEADLIDTIQATSGNDMATARNAATIATMGFSERVNRRVEVTRLPMGRMQYSACTLMELPHLAPITVELSIEGGAVEEREIVLLALANTQYFGGGMKIAPKASVFDAKLDLVTIGPVSRTALASQLIPLRMGWHIHHPQVEVTQVSSLKILSANYDCRADGEHFALTPLELKVNPRSLWVAGASAISPKN